MRNKIGRIGNLWYVRDDRIRVAVMFCVVVVSRIPFVCIYLFNSDSTRFALAMEHFDVSQMRPHAPGYILYIALAKLVDFFVHDAAMSLVGISIVANALTVCMLYCLSLKMFGRPSAMVSALLLASSPLFWHSGELALPYSLEGLLATSFGFACYRIMDGDERWASIAAAILALATGTRQNVIILLAPLWIYVLWKLPVRRMVTSLLIYGVVCAAWFAPLIAFSGGLRNYMQTLGAQTRAVVIEPIPLLEQMKIRGGILAQFMLYSFTLGAAPLLYFVGKFFDIESIAREMRVRFIAFWIVPPICFFIIVNLWNPGQFVVVLPPLILFLAQSLIVFSQEIAGIGWRLGKSFGGIGKRWLIYGGKFAMPSMVAAIVVVNIAIFAIADTPVSYADIKEEDQQLAEMIRMTKEKTAQGKTIILACFLNTQAGYYLPDFLVYCPLPIIFDQSKIPLHSQNLYISNGRRTHPQTYWKDTGFEIQPIVIPEGIDTLVVWEAALAEYYQSSQRPLMTHYSGDKRTEIFTIRVRGGETIRYGFHRWTLE